MWRRKQDPAAHIVRRCRACRGKGSFRINGRVQICTRCNGTGSAH